MDKVTLLPCPFCGGEAKVSGPYGWYRQYCISHSCKAFYTGAQESFKDYPNTDYAITAWNTRATPAPDSEKLLEAGDWLNTLPGVKASDQFIAADRRLFEAMIARVIAASAVTDLKAYDAGLLGDGGGGDVNWWQDYLRAELDRAHEFYSDQIAGATS